MKYKVKISKGFWRSAKRLKQNILKKSTVKLSMKSVNQSSY